MARQVLIIHGWSDTSDSFHALSRFLGAHGFDVRTLWLGDYISMEDDVRVQDVAIRMADVIDQRIAQGDLQSSFDIIVHSTGGLVVRAWLTTRYHGAAERCPAKRLLMLAPANYGSKLAAIGKTMLARLVKGFKHGFQTGTSMLNDLELASPFQWELAQRDVLVAPGGDTTRYYGEDRVWPFVIVGTRGYTAMLRQIANENGSDGTVRVCAANLNARGVTIDFRETDPERMMQLWDSRLQCDVPLAVLPTRTHGSIIDPDRSDSDNIEDIVESDAEKQQLGSLILEALGCASFDAYRDIQARWEDLSNQTANRHLADPSNPQSECFHQYMQLNAYVVDDHGKPVPDYFLEFFSNPDEAQDPANVYLHANVIEDVKKNSQNEALRNLYFDRTDLVEGYYPRFSAGEDPVLYMSISAAPPGASINYFDPGDPSAAGKVPVHLEGDKTKRWLRHNSTHFVQVIIPRRPVEDVFRLTRFES
jgi:pimeloyl-ACP methyl ester carboxylesterase